MLPKPTKKSSSVTVSKDLDVQLCLSVALTFGLQLAYKLTVSMLDSKCFRQFFVYFVFFGLLWAHFGWIDWFWCTLVYYWEGGFKLPPSMSTKITPHTGTKKIPSSFSNKSWPSCDLPQEQRNYGEGSVQEGKAQPKPNHWPTTTKSNPIEPDSPPTPTRSNLPQARQYKLPCDPTERNSQKDLSRKIVVQKIFVQENLDS